MAYLERDKQRRTQQRILSLLNAQECVRFIKLHSKSHLDGEGAVGGGGQPDLA